MISQFIYDSDDFNEKLRKNVHDAGEVRFLNSIATPGMQVIEVGANSGVTAIATARAIGNSGHLYAFEPIHEYYMMLMDNLSLNKATNVSAYNLAVSDHTGRIPFYKREAGSSGIAPSTDGEMLWVEATTITEFLTVEEIGKIDLLNLDCEGSELHVLRGAHATLRTHAPHIFCELHHGYLGELGQSADDVIDYLIHLGYGVRLLQVDELQVDARSVTPKTCSHIYATRHPRPASANNRQGEHR